MIGLGIDYAIQFHARLDEESRKGSLDDAVFTTITRTGEGRDVRNARHIPWIFCHVHFHGTHDPVLRAGSHHRHHEPVTVLSLVGIPAVARG